MFFFIHYLLDLEIHNNKKVSILPNTNNSDVIVYLLIHSCQIFRDYGQRWEIKTFTGLVKYGGNKYSSLGSNITKRSLQIR